MKPDARLQSIESRVTALTAIIDKQNETIALQAQRISALEARLPNPPTETAYKPLFDRWPGNAR